MLTSSQDGWGWVLCHHSSLLAGVGLYPAWGSCACPRVVCVPAVIKCPHHLLLPLEPPARQHAALSGAVVAAGADAGKSTPAQGAGKHLARLSKDKDCVGEPCPGHLPEPFVWC